MEVGDRKDRAVSYKNDESAAWATCCQLLEDHAKKLAAENVDWAVRSEESPDKVWFCVCILRECAGCTEAPDFSAAPVRLCPWCICNAFGLPNVDGRGFHLQFREPCQVPACEEHQRRPHCAWEKDSLEDAWLGRASSVIIFQRGYHGEFIYVMSQCMQAIAQLAFNRACCGSWFLVKLYCVLSLSFVQEWLKAQLVHARGASTNLPCCKGTYWVHECKYREICLFFQGCQTNSEVAKWTLHHFNIVHASKESITCMLFG